MRIDNISSVSHRAYIPKPLNEKLFEESIQRGLINDFFKQTKNMENWGRNTSCLSLISEKTQEGLKHTLALVNSYSAPFKKVLLPNKTSLLDSFLALKKADIDKAEQVMFR